MSLANLESYSPHRHARISVGRALRPRPSRAELRVSPPAIPPIAFTPPTLPPAYRVGLHPLPSHGNRGSRRIHSTSCPRFLSKQILYFRRTFIHHQRDPRLHSRSLLFPHLPIARRAAAVTFAQTPPSSSIPEREMCPWAISKYFGDLVSNTSALV
jgi:hypothetical protein